MVADEQNTNDFSQGFLVKDKSGQLKKIQDDAFIDTKQAIKPAPVAQPAPIIPQIQQKIAVKPSEPPRPSLAPQPPVSTSPKAAFYFAPEDEEEIQKHAESLKALMAETAAPSTGGTAEVSAVAEKIRRQFKVNFNDETLDKRFGKVLESYFSDLRNQIETEEVLTRPQKIGGLALATDLASQIMQFAQTERTNLKNSTVKAPPVLTFGYQPVTPIGAPVRPGLMADAPPAFVPRPQPKPIAPSLAPHPPTAAPKPITDETKKLAQDIEKEIAKAIPTQPKEPPPLAKPMPPADNISGIAYARQAELTRPQMVDIKQPARVVGPVEELSFIDMKEFRKLSPNPTDAADRVLEKINLLQEESWQMRMDAVKAWKRSEAFQIYLEIGKESLSTGIRIAEIIRSRVQSGKPNISMDEFAAINYLNSSLAM